MVAALELANSSSIALLLDLENNTATVLSRPNTTRRADSSRSSSLCASGAQKDKSIRACCCVEKTSSTAQLAVMPSTLIILKDQCVNEREMLQSEHLAPNDRSFDRGSISDSHLKIDALPVRVYYIRNGGAENLLMIAQSCFGPCSRCCCSHVGMR